MSNPYQAPTYTSDPNAAQQRSPLGVRNLSGLANFCKVMLVANIIFTVVALLFASTDKYKNAIISAGNGIDDGSGILEQLVLLGIIGIVVFILTVIAVCIWTYRAMANTWAVHKVSPKITPGWAVGWYFIPFANLWKPYEAMTEIWSGLYGHGKSRAILITWWLCWIFSGILDRVSAKIDILDLKATFIVDFISGILATIAAVLLIRIIGKITRRQNSKVRVI